MWKWFYKTHRSARMAIAGTLCAMIATAFLGLVWGALPVQPINPYEAVQQADHHRLSAELQKLSPNDKALLQWARQWESSPIRRVLSEQQMRVLQKEVETSDLKVADIFRISVELSARRDFCAAAAWMRAGVTRAKAIDIQHQTYADNYTLLQSLMGDDECLQKILDGKALEDRADLALNVARRLGLTLQAAPARLSYICGLSIQNRIDEAKRAADQCLAEPAHFSSEQLAQLHLMRAQVLLYGLKDPAAALADARIACDHSTTMNGGLLYKFEALAELGRTAEAKQVLEEIKIKINPHQGFLSNLQNYLASASQQHVQQDLMAPTRN
ncbi:MAG TPA: hypothetical protein VGG19_02405 [Tepidisphaeraceae bacterium]|jgi:hypothetical protein